MNQKLTPSLLNWREIAQPQIDGYDTSIILQLAYPQGYQPSTNINLIPGEPSDEFSECITASINHPNLDKTWQLLSFAPAIWQQLQTLIETITIYLNQDESKADILMSYGFGKLAATINHPVNLAKNLVTQIARDKFSALNLESIILNPPELTYYNPFSAHQQQPLIIILQDLYIYTHHYRLFP